MIESKKDRSQWTLVLIISAAFLLMFLNRLHFGIETSDEAFYEVVGYRLIQGNIPFGDMWEVSATNAYLMAPFLFFFKLFSNETEGLHLYLRISYTIFQVIGLIAIYMYAKKDIKKPQAFLLGMVFLLFAPYGINNFSYNNMSNLFFAASSCMLFIRIDNDRRIFEYLSGVFMALSILAYPSMIYCCVVFAAVAVLLLRCKGILRYLLMYACGGFTVALPILLHIAFSVGMGRVMENLSIISSSQGLSEPNLAAILATVSSVLLKFKEPFETFGIFFTASYLIIIITALFSRTKSISKYLVIIYVIEGGLFASCDNITASMNCFLAISIIAPVSVLLSEHRGLMAKKCIAEWGLSLTMCFVIAFSSSGGAENAKSGIVFSAIVAVKLIIEAIQEDCKVKDSSIVICILLVSLLFVDVFLFYNTMYRDEKYSLLTEKIDTGIYKGIYTTPERKQHIKDLEMVMKQIEKKDESVMILYHSCYAYLMVEMLPKTPTSWGCIDYASYGFDNEDLFMKYLETDDNIPQNIFIIDIPEEFDYARQQAEIYEIRYRMLNRYIKEHYEYEGVHEKGQSGKVYQYRRNVRPVTKR